MKKILFVLLCFVSLSQADEYNVTVKGNSAGKAKLDMVVGDKNYAVNLTLHPNIMAKMFGIADMRDSSKGIVKNGHYYPKTYRRQTLKGNSLFAVDFLGKQAKQTHKGKTRTVNIDPKGQDPLTQIAQIQYDLRHNKLASRYHLITEKKQRLYLANLQNVSGGKLVVLKQSPQPKRIIRLWFNRQGKLLRMQKEKRGKIDFDMSK